MPIFDRDHADSPEKAYVYILRCADGTLYFRILLHIL